MNIHVQLPTVDQELEDIGTAILSIRCVCDHIKKPYHMSYSPVNNTWKFRARISDSVVIECFNRDLVELSRHVCKKIMEVANLKPEQIVFK